MACYYLKSITRRLSLFMPNLKRKMLIEKKIISYLRSQISDWRFKERLHKKSRFEKRLFICGQLLVFIRIAARKATPGPHFLLDERFRKLLSVFSW